MFHSFSLQLVLKVSHDVLDVRIVTVFIHLEFETVLVSFWLILFLFLFKLISIFSNVFIEQEDSGTELNLKRINIILL